MFYFYYYYCISFVCESFQILKCLENGGAVIQKFTMDKATHVIYGKQYEETHIQEAMELYDLPIVNEFWVLASAKLGRLAFNKPYDLTSNKLFTNFVFTFNKIESQDQRKLFAMITFNGGKVQKNFDKNVTHLICGSGQDIIYNKAICLNKTSLTIVTPDWITDSIKKKTLVDREIYHPRLLIPATVMKTPNIISMTQGSLAKDSNESTLTGNIQQKSPSGTIQSQVTAGTRPPIQNRPVVQSMQHTTQQINQILQSQIQQQQKLQQIQQNSNPPNQISQVTPPPQNPTSLLQHHAQQHAQALAQQQQTNVNFSANQSQPPTPIPTSQSMQLQKNLTPQTPQLQDEKQDLSSLQSHQPSNGNFKNLKLLLESGNNFFFSFRITKSVSTSTAATTEPVSHSKHRAPAETGRFYGRSTISGFVKSKPKSSEPIETAVFNATAATISKATNFTSPKFGTESKYECK